MVRVLSRIRKLLTMYHNLQYIIIRNKRTYACCLLKTFALLESDSLIRKVSCVIFDFSCTVREPLECNRFYLRDVKKNFFHRVAQNGMQMSFQTMLVFSTKKIFLGTLHKKADSDYVVSKYYYFFL